MTEYILLEEVSSGRQSWDTMVRTSREAASTPADGSQIYLAEGDEHSLQDLYIAMAVGSANDATIALADHISGTEELFVEKMNQTAQELGLTTAQFTSATGLAATTMISARDMAKLSRTLIQTHPEFLDYASISTYKFRERDKDPMVNYNWMLESHGTNPETPSLQTYSYKGVDGMKTGYIPEAGYCFTGTAMVGDRRVISVVMGTATKGERFRETAKLYDYAFTQLDTQVISKAGTVIAENAVLPVKKGVAKEVALSTAGDLSVLARKGVPLQADYTVNMAYTDLTAPVAAGAVVGTVTYAYQEPQLGIVTERTVDLVTAEAVNKASWWKLMLQSIGTFFSNLWSTIIGWF
jgi:D-alanyl-D-alanine carboxypeptidase (penicillin-binding protein 5/6)